MPTAEGASMFSDRDVQDLSRLFNPMQILHADQGRHTDSLPPLLPLSTGGFVTQAHVSKQIEHAVTQQSHRPSVISLGHDLGIDTDLVLELVDASPALALLSRDRSSIITKSEKDDLEIQLRETTSHGVVSKDQFLRDHDLASIDRIIYALEAKEVKLLDLNGHIISADYARKVKEAIQHLLSQANETSTPIVLSATSLPGAPPMWYISQALDDFIQQDHTSKQYHIDTRFDGIYCTPDRFYKKHSESEITRLKEGQIPLLDIQQFYYEFNALYSDLQDARDHLSKDPEVQVGSSIAISRRWLSVCMERYIKQLEVNGYTDIAEVFESDWKANWRSELSSRLEGILRDTLDQKKDLAVQSQLFGTLVITTNTYGSAMTFLVDKTKLSALNQWNLRKEQPARELQFQVSEVLASLPSEELVSRAMTGDKGVCKSMEEHFWAEITRQEDQNEADFAKFWTDRVLARYYNYQEGLASVEDATLGDNLACVLSAYLVKELLPDSIAKAKAQHIVLSRNTIKNVARFEGLLASSPKTMAELNKMIDKFGKKQKIAQPDADLLAEAKRASIDDMVRRMQKQSDGPLLFLTLILVLRAERRSGVLYATGKLSPKILKDMKATLDTETYERLVKWKDSVRAGTLTLEDKKNMKETATRV